MSPELYRDYSRRPQIRVAYIFISHDLAVIAKMSHRVAVLDQGRIVETGPTGLVLADPQHPYTRELLAAVPVADPMRRRPARENSSPQRKSPVRPLGWEAPKLRYASLPGEHVVAVD